MLLITWVLVPEFIKDPVPVETKFKLFLTAQVPLIALVTVAVCKGQFQLKFQKL